jgi:hypothetical protein
LEENEKTRDVYHQDDLLWGEGIPDMVARVVDATERDQKEQVGLVASIHPDLTQTGGSENPEERQPLQRKRQLKSVPVPQPKPNPTPKLKPAPAPAPRPAQTLTPRTTSVPKGATSAAPTPTR